MKAVRLTSAIEFAKAHGFARVLVSELDRDANPLVTIHQDWTPEGVEKAVFRRAFGRYRGTFAGSSLRDRG